MAELQIMLLGCGKMGSAMLKGWLADTKLVAQFTIIEPCADHLGWTGAHQRVAVYQDCEAAISAGAPTNSVIVLAVKPQMMDEAIAAFGPLRDEKTAFLSIAAGISTAWLKARLGADTPVFRAMPNTPAAIGRGVTALYCDFAVAELSALAKQLLHTIGTVVAIDDEALMDAVTAVSGSGPAYVFLMAEAMAAAGVSAGLPEALAKQLAEATITGSGALIEAVDDAPAILRENVTSKGGTTAAALSVLMADDGLAALMERAVWAAKKRSVELGA
ncbi:MAG: pyrroline-5-carboxylate reductase [Pseudomonadota bacterium]|nr:pyrroline-5-carboxylate reductase [Pseudomonadota bacterium]